MTSRELADEQRHDPASGARRGADRQRPAQLALLGRELLEQPPLRLQEPLSSLVEHEARLGRLDPPTRAIEELPSQPLLERPHLEADRRLRDAEPLSRLREAAPLDDRAERRELPRIHKQSGDYLLDEPK